MGLFKRNTGQKPVAATVVTNATNAPSSPATPGLSGVPDLTAELKRQLQTARARVFAYSDHVKQVSCYRCGAPKQLPSKTAYVYCDNCGALTDYDFRIGNFDTNAALTNQVYAYLIAPFQPALDISSATGDKERYRSLLRPVYAEWVRQCPQANSPRATSEPEFQERTVNYLVEAMACRDFDQGIKAIERQLVAATRTLQPIPQPDGSFLVGEGIWQVATLYKQQMELSYKLLADHGVLALDPEEAPAAVWLRMEYTYFCQNWLSKIPAADADRFLDFFGVKGEYATMKITNAETRKCGGCGDD